MLRELEITENDFYIPTPPYITRQNAFTNLFDYINYNHNQEINIENNIYKTITSCPIVQKCISETIKLNGDLRVSSNKPSIKRFKSF